MAVRFVTCLVMGMPARLTANDVMEDILDTQVGQLSTIMRMGAHALGGVMIAAAAYRHARESRHGKRDDEQRANKYAKVMHGDVVCAGCLANSIIN